MLPGRDVVLNGILRLTEEGWADYAPPMGAEEERTLRAQLLSDYEENAMRTAEGKIRKERRRLENKDLVVIQDAAKRARSEAKRTK